MIKLDPNIVSELDFDRDNKKGGVDWINKDKTNIIHKDLFYVELNSLYANLLVAFYEGGHLDFLNKNYPLAKPKDLSPIIKKVKINLEKQKSKSGSWQDSSSSITYLNSLYGKELRNQAYPLFDIYNQYMSKVYKVLRLRFDIIYIDTDRFYTSSIKFGTEIQDYLDENGFDWAILNTELFIMEERKRYASYDWKNGIKLRGYHEVWFDDPDDPKSLNMRAPSWAMEIFIKIKKEIRNKKIEQVFNVKY